MNDKNSYVTASEIGEYTYCPRAWWLRRNGLLPDTPQMLTGTTAHNSLASQVLRYPIFKFLIVIVFIMFLLFLYLFLKSL